MVSEKVQYGFRKTFDNQHCVFYMIKNWGKSLNEGSYVGVLLTHI